MWLHKFLPQPCFDNAGPEGDSGGGGGNTANTMKDMAGVAAGSPSIGAASGYGGGGTDGGGIMMTGGGYSETAQGIPGYGTPQQAKATNAASTTSGTTGRSGGSGTTSTVTTPKVVTPPVVTVPKVTTPKTPTIAAPTLAQLTALTPKSYTAPVTAQNAATYGPAGFMSVPSVASTPALANSIANAATVSRAISAAPNTGNTQVSSLGSSGGFSGGAAASKGLAETAASVGTPGGISGGAMASRGLDGGGGGQQSNVSAKGDFGGGTQSNAAAKGDLEGPSFASGPQGNLTSKGDFGGYGIDAPSNMGMLAASSIGNQSTPSNVASKSNFGVPSLNTPSGTNLAAKSDFGVPSLNTPSGLLSVSDGMQLPSDFADLGSYMANGFAPSQVGILAANEAFAQQRQPAELTAIPSRQNTSISLSPDTLAAASAFNNAVKAQQSNPYGTPATRDTNAQVAAYGQTNPTISTPGMTSPSTRADIAGALSQMAAQQAAAQRAQQAQASTAQIGGMLSQMDSRPQPANTPNAQPMPGGMATANIGPNFGIVRPALQAGRGLLDYSRNIALGANQFGVPIAPGVEGAAGLENRSKLSSPGASKTFEESTLPKLSLASQIFGQTLKINDAIPYSGSSRERNTRGSQHFKGTAVDINTRGMSNDEKLSLMNALKAAGFTAFGLGANILHADTGRQRSWSYSTTGKTWAGMNIRDAKQLARSSLSDDEKEALLAKVESGGDVGDADIGDFLDAALTDEQAQAYLDQQGYSQTPEGAWTDGAQTFDTVDAAIESLPLMTKLQLWLWSQRGGTPPPSGRDQIDRGGRDRWFNDWVARNAGLSGVVGNDNGAGSGGGTGSDNGSGVWTGGPPTYNPPPGFDPRNLGLLYRPYSNPFSANPFGPPRDPWLAA